MNNGYIESLQQNSDYTQPKLDNLLTRYNCLPVGNGYLDIIVDHDNLVSFIDHLSSLRIVIQSIGWWCHATQENAQLYGCPHGYGGPQTTDGWYSEMSHEHDEIDRDLLDMLSIKYTPEIVKIINTKAWFLIKTKRTQKFPDGSILTYRNNPCLTSSLDIWLPGQISTKSS